MPALNFKKEFVPLIETGNIQLMAVGLNTLTKTDRI